MRKLVLPEIKEFQYDEISYDLVFNGLTYLSGDSSTGKTLLVSALKAYCALYNIPLTVLDFASASSDILALLKSQKNSFIVVDNADILLGEEERDYISTDSNNQYLIIGRNPEGLYITNYIAKKLVFKNKTFTFEPLF